MPWKQPVKMLAVAQIGRQRALGTRVARSEADAHHERRRAEVYHSEGHAEAKRSGKWTLPRTGTPEREQLVQRIRELKAEGMSHLRVAAVLELDLSAVRRLCKQNDIRSVNVWGGNPGSRSRGRSYELGERE